MLKGERLDRPTYSVLQSDLGGGSSGEVLLADHEIFGVRVVQKTVSLLGVVDGVARSEPRILKTLKHDHLINVHEAQWTPGRSRTLSCVTFTTDYYEGRCIHYAMSEGHRFGVGDTLAVVEGVLKALVYLHDDRGLLHRDIKPANIMLDADRRHAYVGDLGSAAELDPATRTTDAYGGTPLYRAPEASANVLDVRSDLYGVGAVMIEMLNGPYDYDAVDRDKVDQRLATGRRSLVDREYAPGPWVPTNMARIVRKLVAVDPDDRFDSAHQALRAVQNVRCVTWHRVAGTDLVGTWEGDYPPDVAPGRARVHQVTAAPIVSGKYAGMVKLTARWRPYATASWRNYARLETRSAAGDAKTLARFFRAVEAAAQEAPTP